MTSAIEPPTGDEIHIWRVALGEGGRAAARAALGRLLAGYLGTEVAPELSRGRLGKPRLAADPGRLSFNLSHSGELGLVAIAAGGAEVGVDLERLRPRRDLVRLAARSLPAAEAALVEAAGEEEREAVFYAAWTRHEARVKCAGTGIFDPPPGPEVVARQLEIDPGYAAAVATVVEGVPSGAPIFVRRFEFVA